MILKAAYKKLLTAAAAALLLTANSGAALATNLRFTPQPDTNGGAIFGRVALNKFGTLALPRGRATFKSHSVEISAVAEYQFERQVVLSGPILKCSSITDGKQSVVNGIAYFQDGDWLRYLDNAAPDKIITPTHTYEGQITALKNGFVEITTGQLVTNVPTDQIVSVASPRAYTFSMVVKPYIAAIAGEPLSGDTEIVSMRPTSDVLTLSVVKRDPLLASDGDISTKKLVILGTFLTAAQISQFIPMAIVFGPLRNQQVQQYHSRFANYYSQLNFQSAYSAAGGQFPITPYAPGAIPSAGGL